MSDFSSLLDIAIRQEATRESHEAQSAEDRKQERGKLIERVLTHWEGHEAVSFASAFRITGNQIQDNDSFNSLEDKSEEFDDRYASLWSLFDQLSTPPERGYGRWPWNILRDPIQHNGDQRGLFPPQLLHLNRRDDWSFDDAKFKKESCDPLGSQIHLDIPYVPDDPKALEEWSDKTKRVFSDLKEDEKSFERESWRWYAAFLTAVGDKIRQLNRKSTGEGDYTESVVYVLGTRKEFARRPESDYGLIVGFTGNADVQDPETRSSAINNVLGAWNVMAVAPHILEDANRIGRLEAAQQLTHTFKTYIDTIALPNVERSLRKQGTDKSESDIPDHVAGISKLTSMMGFVARESDGKLREEDVETYDLRETVKHQLAEQLEGYDYDGDEPNSDEAPFYGDWICKFYLSSILAEVAKNVRMHGTGEDAVEEVSVTQDDGNVVITVKNEVDSTGDSDTPAAERSVSGRSSLDSFFEAMGGGVKTRETDNDDGRSFWTTRMYFDRKTWEKRLKGPEGEGEGQDENSGQTEVDYPSGARGLIPKESPPDDEEVGFRVLLLDDELADVSSLEPSLSNFTTKKNMPNIPDGKWARYQRAFGSTQEKRQFKALYHGGIKMEIVLCPSVYWAQQYLLDESVHFDISLADIDFTKDPHYQRRGEEPPELGGLLFAIGLIDRTKVYTSVFTAKDELLRRHSDYEYLTQLNEKDRLGQLSFEEGRKTIGPSLSQSFSEWAVSLDNEQSILLSELRPEPQSAVRLVEELKTESDDGSAECLYLRTERPGMGNCIPFGVFMDFLDEERKAKLQAELSRGVCGHALLRYLFCTIAHGEDELFWAFNGELGDNQDRFDKAWDEACDLFEIDDRDNLKKNILSDKKYKKYYRIDLSRLFSNCSEEDVAYLYMISENPGCAHCGYGENADPRSGRRCNWCEIKETIRGLVLEKKDDGGYEGEVCVCVNQISENDTNRGRIFTFKGTRTDGRYFNQDSGGGDLFDLRNLPRSAQELYLDGPEGRLYINPGGETRRREEVPEENRPDQVSLVLKVRHVPYDNE